MKKLLLSASAALALTACGQLQMVTPSLQPQATDALQKEADKLRREAFVDKLELMSVTQLEKLAEEIEVWEANNLYASKDDADEFALALMEGMEVEPQLEPLSSSPIDETISNWEDLGPKQKALCMEQPINCGKTAVAKHHAMVWSENTSGFSNGSNGGRIDAARHLYWNAYMTRAAGANWAKQFSDAHELDHPPSNLLGKVPQQMDFYNNYLGRVIGNQYPANKFSIEERL